jgi:hypothetical protein
MPRVRYVTSLVCLLMALPISSVQASPGSSQAVQDLPAGWPEGFPFPAGASTRSVLRTCGVNLNCWTEVLVDTDEAKRVRLLGGRFARLGRSGHRVDLRAWCRVAQVQQGRSAAPRRIHRLFPIAE